MWCGIIPFGCVPTFSKKRTGPPHLAAAPKAARRRNAHPESTSLRQVQTVKAKQGQESVNQTDAPHPFKKIAPKPFPTIHGRTPTLNSRTTSKVGETPTGPLILTPRPYHAASDVRILTYAPPCLRSSQNGVPVFRPTMWLSNIGALVGPPPASVPVLTAQLSLRRPAPLPKSSSYHQRKPLDKTDLVLSK